MINDLMDYLLNLCRKEDIDVKFTNELDEYTPDICYPKHRKIIINNNCLTTVDPTFRLAHEINHILHGDTESQKIYAFSPLSKKDEENTANYHAIKLLARIAYQDTPMEYRNYLDFMDFFGLPLHFENMVKRAVSSV